MTPRPLVIVTRRLTEGVERELAARYDVRLNADDRQFTPAELRGALREADVVLCTLTDRLTADILAATPRRARLLANFGVGVDHIDLDAARHAGLVVTNTPGVLTGDTADLTMLLVLAVARRAFEGDRELRAGRWTGWRPTHLLGTRVHGATLGIVGMGRIGQAVARRARGGFGMTILYYSTRTVPTGGEEATEAERCATLDELLARSDFVSLHCPLTAATRGLMNAERLARMREGAFLINTARGELVDERALLAALERGALAGAGLDVYENEPSVSRALLDHPRIVTLPHLGSATTEGRTAMGLRALANIAAFLDETGPPDRVA